MSHVPFDTRLVFDTLASVRFATQPGVLLRMRFFNEKISVLSSTERWRSAYRRALIPSMAFYS